jgi:hypothetical protein
VQLLADLHDESIREVLHGDEDAAVVIQNEQDVPILHLVRIPVTGNRAPLREPVEVDLNDFPVG